MAYIFHKVLQQHFSGVVVSLVKTVFITNLHLRLVVKELKIGRDLAKLWARL